MRIAILLRGAISKLNKTFRTKNSLYEEGEYVNYRAVYRSIYKHIIESNNSYTFDFFIHCWNQDLEDNLCQLYKPQLYLFENNNKYISTITNILNKHNNSDNLFSNVSQAISMSKVVELCKKYELENKLKYDYIILYR